jgi:hypothetical protein
MSEEHPQAVVAREALAAGDKSYQTAAEALKVMTDDGLTQREIARQVGCSQFRVNRLLRALDLYTTRAGLKIDGHPATFGDFYARLNNNTGSQHPGGNRSHRAFERPDDAFEPLYMAWFGAWIKLWGFVNDHPETDARDILANLEEWTEQVRELVDKQEVAVPA